MAASLIRRVLAGCCAVSKTVWIHPDHIAPAGCKRRGRVVFQRGDVYQVEFETVGIKPKRVTAWYWRDALLFSRSDFYHTRGFTARLNNPKKGKSSHLPLSTGQTIQPIVSHPKHPYGEHTGRDRDGKRRAGAT